MHDKRWQKPHSLSSLCLHAFTEEVLVYYREMITLMTDVCCVCCAYILQMCLSSHRQDCMSWCVPARLVAKNLRPLSDISGVRDVRDTMKRRFLSWLRRLFGLLEPEAISLRWDFNATIVLLSFFALELNIAFIVLIRSHTNIRPCSSQLSSWGSYR